MEIQTSMKYKVTEKIITLRQKFSRYWPQITKLKPRSLMKLAQSPKLVLLNSIFFPIVFWVFFIFIPDRYLTVAVLPTAKMCSVEFSVHYILKVCFWALA